MSRIQAALLAVLLVVVAVVALPPYLDTRKVSGAILDLELIADAALRYEFSTAVACGTPSALLADSGVDGWQGPYLTSDSDLITPWGGRYVFDLDRGLVGIGAGDTTAPAKYRLGGEAELAMPIGEDPSWWPARASGS
ncbi:hypothetical protein HN371_13145 [Candidatus Poribacteria bacterium]|jgi:hypothetical protein|nr:hypothetical protein [Candidatus Poribacteria bacterium]MBT5534258.1 hypothetical protein [Candidatus Poribacteria bacterium]MBT5713567.1 hypothetical protein [Candidatus Poribacteria bacterium]MBT7100277.1 hypothetical protein [Candidatus Poribacteria bacterium]MBT7806586.1 hypothetical protein [Candidatus Poribacteria bacterium]